MDPTLLAVICARGGSKGIPHKNIINFCEKPLIAWTIQAALSSKAITRCVLSSDDAEIIEAAKSFGCEVPFIRPKELARDDTPGIAPVIHALEALPSYDYVILLQPTSPLRTAEDIDNAFQHCILSSSPCCVSVTEADNHPYLTYQLGSEEKFLKPFCGSFENALPRQKLPKAYALNGAIYIAQTEWLLKNRSFLSSETSAFIMPKCRSIDIDTPEDLIIAKQMMERLISQ